MGPLRIARIATRGSALALAQATLVANALEKALGTEVSLVQVSTRGDRSAAPLARIGGKGLFVKEVEAAVLDGRADLAVHSAKDLPAELAPELALAAFPERADPRDALVARERGTRFADLPGGARVGTGSVRRRAQLLRLRPDLEVVPLRGNVDTRLGKLETGGLDAVLLACAGLDRLGLGERIDERLAPGIWTPAVCQGTLALQARAGSEAAHALAALDHAPTRARTEAERAFLCGAAGDCNVPLAAHAEWVGDTLQLRAFLWSDDGKTELRAERSGSAASAVGLGEDAAREILATGGDEILAALRAREGA